ncbi:hypothetical protein FQZ97_488650 [compost metagenome]
MPPAPAASSSAIAFSVPARLFCAEMSITEPAACRRLPCRLSSTTSPPALYLLRSLNTTSRPDRSSTARSVSTRSRSALSVSLPLGSATAVSSVNSRPRRLSSAPSAASPVAAAGAPAGAATRSVPPAVMRFTEPASPVSSGATMFKLPPLYA